MDTSIIDKLITTLHERIRDALRAGNVNILFSGIASDELSRDLHLSEIDVCNAARCDSRIVIVEWLREGRSCRLLTREADALRAVIMSVPHIDFKVYVYERLGLRVHGTCRGPGACISALIEMLQGTNTENEDVLRELFEEGANIHPVFRTPWAYQVEAWKLIFEALTSGKRKSIAIMAGTGEGKTEAFLIPILAYLLTSKLRGENPRVLLLYPRKALATDQLERILRLIYIVNDVLERRSYGVKLRVAILDGDTPYSWWERGALLARDERGEIHPLSPKPYCVSQEKSCIEHEHVLPYKRIRCPRCSLQGVEEPPELIVEKEDAERLLKRDYLWSREFIQEELKKVMKSAEVSHLISQQVVRGPASHWTQGLIPILRCPRCGHIIDYLYLTKTDLAIPEDKPDIIVASIDAVGVRLGDPTLKSILRDIKAIVVDEAHMLTGVNGAHHSLIVRRIIHENLDSNPVLVLSSATISNPEDIAITVYPEAGHPDVIDATDATRYRDIKNKNVTGFNYYLFILPSESINFDTAATSAAFTLLHSRRKVLVFTESRRDAEDMAMYVIQRGETTAFAEDLDECRDTRFCIIGVNRVSGKLGQQLAKWLRDMDWRKTVIALDDEKLLELRSRQGSLVDPKEVDYHHAGLVQRERRRVEEEFKRGVVRLLAATSTLELGIDIGELDTILLLGFPRIPASFFQRAGRAGRRRRVDTLIVTLLRGSYRDLHYYANIENILRDPRRYFNVHLDLEGVPDLVASHTLARILDELAERGTGYSPTTLATLMFATRINRDAFELLKHKWSTLHRSFNTHLTRLDVAPEVEEAMNIINYLVNALESCPELRVVIALAAVYPWPPLNKQAIRRYVEAYAKRAHDCVLNLLQRVYAECRVEIGKRYRISDVIEEEREFIRKASKKGIVTEDLAGSLRCLESRFAEAATYTALLERLSEIINSVKEKQQIDFTLITLSSILELARREYIRGGV